jgi:hypothetical protein
LIVNTIVWEQAKRLRSYELLAEVFELGVSSVGGRERMAVEVSK